MNNEQDILFIIVFVIFTIVCLFIVPDADKGVAILSGLAVLLGAASLTISRRAFEQTQNSLELTKKEIRKAEIQLKIRDIEKKLDFFYNPMSDHFYLKGKVLKEGLKDEDIRNRVHTESYRYLAKKETRIELEKNRENKYTGDVAPLITCLCNDIKELEKDLKNNKDKLNDLEKEK